MEADFLLLGALIAPYLVMSQLSFKYIPCPEHLKPANNKDKRTREYFDYYGNFFPFFHAVSSVILSALVLCIEGMSYNAPTTPFMKVVIYNSLAYFISDMIIAIYYGYMSGALFCHHIGSILAMATVFITQAGGAEVAVGILLAESSNPCNLSREILKHWKQEKTQLYFLMSVGFILFFVGARFFVFPFYMIALYPSPSHIAIKLMIAFVWFVSWHWLFIIVNFGVKALKDAFDGDGKSGKPNVWRTPYAVLGKLRKNKPFLAAYYLSTAWLSFGTLYLAHGKS